MEIKDRVLVVEDDKRISTLSLISIFREIGRAHV